MGTLFFVLILVSVFIPMIRTSLQNQAGRPKMTGPVTTDPGASPRYLMAQLNRLTVLADNPDLSDQQRAVIESQIERLTEALDDALGEEEVAADQALAERGEAGESMLDEVEFDQAQAQMAASLADQMPAPNPDDWLLVDDREDDRLQLEVLRRPQGQPTPSQRHHRLGRLSRGHLKEAVIYSEILAPKYRAPKH